jgi:hypothetical protein
MASGAELRGEFEAAVLAEVTRTGGMGMDRDRLIKEFAARGCKPPTLYRWYRAVMASGRPAARVKSVVKKAAARRAKRAADPSADAAREVADKLPVPVRVEDVAGTGALGIIERLQHVLTAAEDVMKHARTEDGKVRNARLLVGASEHLRRSLETAMKLHDAMIAVQKIDAFNGAVIAAIREETPEVAERLVRRLSQLSVRWSGGPPRAG